jgi:leader peptidase (prepilin peptidase)/N-methyltransferase
MTHILASMFAGLLGVCFGSFLNVCVSRWPEGESIVRPGSHCRSCWRTLAWWENLPLASWMVLRGRCRTCGERISWRYPLVELAVGVLWAAAAWQALGTALTAAEPMLLYAALVRIAGSFVFYWLMVALAVLDAEHLWLPNMLTLPGVAAGFLFTAGYGAIHGRALSAAEHALLAIACAAAAMWMIRWTYRLIRGREGLGLGDVKLMALLAAWLGASGALVAFGLSAGLGLLAALVVLARSAAKGNASAWMTQKLPLGTFLCVGGAISALFGREILAAYLHWAGF